MRPPTAISLPLSGPGWPGVNRYSRPPMHPWKSMPYSASPPISKTDNKTSRRYTMRRLLKYCIIGAITLMAGTAAHAQHELQFNLDYNVNIPTGSFRDFVTHPTYKGFTAGLAYPVNDQISVGLSL